MNLQTLITLNRYFKKYLWTIVAGTLFLTAANFFLVWIPIFIRRTMDEISALGGRIDQPFDSLFTVLFSSEASIILAKNAGFLLGAVALYGILLFATRQTLIVTSRKIEYDIRNELFHKLVRLPQRFYSQRDTGDVYIRATEDVVRVREYFGPAFMYTINTLTRFSFIITMMLIVSPELTLWALLPLPLLSAVAYYISGYIYSHSRKIQQQYSKIAGRAKEAFSSIRLIKSYNREAYEQSRFEQESDSYRRKKLRLDMVESLFHPLLNLLIGISVIIVIWKGGQMVINGGLSIGNIAEFVIYVAYLTWPVASLGYTVNRFQRSLASWKRIERILNEPIEIKDEDHTDPDIDSIKGDITFEQVSFKYPDTDEYVLRDIDLQIKAGEKAAIVGRTGSGKTTLTQLIPRLFDPDKGTIYIDGIDFRKIPLDVLRQEIGYVPQDTFLFSDTIAENIAFGMDNAGMEEIEEAAEQAQVRDNILEFEKKFETILGERGITLSGGQKQRTAIARALIKDPKILVMDDSLSAVDTKTEDAILQHLYDHLENRTTLMISHRISTIKDADKIYYMEEGRIVESGTHDDLLAEKGRYYEMYNKQLLEEELAEI